MTRISRIKIKKNIRVIRAIRGKNSFYSAHHKECYNLKKHKGQVHWI